jgi:predicted flap endonuclease-1-like 5' DNA nuclease
MDGLRWLLLFFGVLVVVGVYLYSRREQKQEQEPPSFERRTPTLEGDDLTRIAGLGLEIAGHLKGVGITTFAQLASTQPSEIRSFLDGIGGFSALDTSTWPDQAQLAAAGEWDQLKEWQDQLDGGA